MTPIVIVFHGRGQGPEFAQELVPAFANAELLAPAGGVVLRRGRTWFQNSSVGIAEPGSVAEAEAAFLTWADTQVRLSEQPAWLCGFSNGGAFAAHLLMRHPARFHGAALLCAPMVLPPWPEGALQGKPVFYAHGDAGDTVVEPHFYASAESYLTETSGSYPSIVRYEGGHALSRQMVADLAAWFTTVRSSA